MELKKLAINRNKLPHSFDKYVVLDVETTGLSPTENTIIEIGCVKVENGMEIDSLSTLINPQTPISGVITRITGITNAMVADAPLIGEYMPILCSFIGHYPVIAYNASFDMGFILNSCPRCQNRGGAPGQMSYFDALTFARKAIPNMPNYRLATMIEHFHLLDTDQTHRALDDARCTYKLFEICKKEFARQRG